LGVPSFHEFALVCQALGQTQSRLQMAELAGEFLARLETNEAAIAARFMVGRTLAQGDAKRLQISGRAIWKIVAAMTGGEDQGEEIFAAAVDFGEAIEMLLRLRNVEPEPALTLAEAELSFAEIAGIEGRNSRQRKLEALHALFERATALEGKYLTKVLIGEMRHGMSEGLMLEAIAKMAARPIAEVRRLNMLEGDVGRVVRLLRDPTGPSTIDRGDGTDLPGSEPKESAPIASVPILPRDDAERVRPLKPMLAQPVPNVRSDRART
jgi:DNA ligase 1